MDIIIDLLTCGQSKVGSWGLNRGHYHLRMVVDTEGQVRKVSVFAGQSLSRLIWGQSSKCVCLNFDGVCNLLRRIVLCCMVIVAIIWEVDEIANVGFSRRSYSHLFSGWTRLR